MMTKAAGLVVAAIAFAAPLCAQTSNGYVFLAPGTESYRGSYGHAGVGGEWISRFHAGVGGEVGYLWGRQFAPSLAVISGNGVFHVPVTGTRFDPFGTLGATVATNGSGAGYLTNFGGGVNYWFRPRFGGRFEIRDHYWHGEGLHLTDFRFGLSFR